MSTRINRRSLLLLPLLVFLTPGFTQAQANVDPTVVRPAPFEGQAITVQADASPVSGLVSPWTMLDRAEALERLLELSEDYERDLVTSYLEEIRAETEIRLSLLEHRRRTYWWQYYSTIFIFVVVHAIVGIGVYLSWLHFKDATAEAPQGPDTVTTVEASFQGLKISSRLVGLIILLISVGFFYLYLQFVYPIT